MMEPIYNKLKYTPTPIAYGLNLDQQLAFLIGVAQSRSVHVTGDRSGFDRTVLSWEVLRAFEVIETLLHFETTPLAKFGRWSEPLAPRV